MSIRKTLAIVLVSGTVLGGVAYASDQAATPVAPAQTAHEAVLDKKIDQDVGRLSQDGAKALSDIQATRLAIFNAQPDHAKTLIHQAKDALVKAAKDDAVFMKAESELTAPGKAATPEKVAEAKTPSTTPVAWLPVDSQMTLAEDFKATPEKMAAISDANQSLKKADRKGALEKLAVADVDVQFVSAVLPLEKTTADVTKAASLIDEGKYYEANAVLKDATDHAMLDVVDIYGQPYKAKAQKAAEAKIPDAAHKSATSAN